MSKPNTNKFEIKTEKAKVIHYFNLGDDGKVTWEPEDDDFYAGFRFHGADDYNEELEIHIWLQDMNLTDTINFLNALTKLATLAKEGK